MRTKQTKHYEPLLGAVTDKQCEEANEAYFRQETASAEPENDARELPDVQSMIVRSLNCSPKYAESEWKALPRWTKDLLSALRTSLEMQIGITSQVTAQRDELLADLLQAENARDHYEASWIKSDHDWLIIKRQRDELLNRVTQLLAALKRLVDMISHPEVKLTPWGEAEMRKARIAVAKMTEWAAIANVEGKQ